MNDLAVARSTIFALSSGPPPAAISVIRISGPKAHDAGIALCEDLPEARRAAVRTLVDPQSGETLDHALVLRFDAPNSATGEDLVELHCHGGKAVVAALIDALGRLEGLRSAEPGEFTRRAFDHGRIDLTEAEGLADLLAAETEAQRRAALVLADGGLRRTIEAWRERLLALSAEAELAIDYVDEDEDADGTPRDRAGVAALRREIEEWLKRPRLAPLRDGIRVVIAGPPNAGKSSLLNALVGFDRAIVSAEAGTTRDHIDVPLSIGGLPFLLTDTAGLRFTADGVEAEGVDRANSLIEAADVLLWMGEPDDRPSHPHLILVRSKADLESRMDETADHHVSAVTGAGIAGLLEALVTQGKGMMPTDGAIALNERQSIELETVAKALLQADGDDVLILAEGLRQARVAFDRITGRAGVEDFLDTLFGNFCLGK